MKLFDHAQKNNPNLKPLADRMRPEKLEDFVGQEKIVGENKTLRNLIQNDTIPSMIFWGPPGSGKTTLAKIISKETKSYFVPMSAVTAGVKDIKQVCVRALNDQRLYQKKTIVFIDEIHRFNKRQQDALLPFVEKGIITLIGATTENPSFEVNNALLSRCHVYVLEKHTERDIDEIIQAALKNKEKGFGEAGVKIKKDAQDLLVNAADGDARTALNMLELAVISARNEKKKEITKPFLRKILQKRALNYDKHGEEHYNLISALHKSVRNSDDTATVYWISRMIEAGEDPRYLFRRMLRMASEDIGLADPQAIIHTNACFQAFEMTGLAEGKIMLIQAAVYLARAQKDNSVYLAEKKAKKDIQETGILPVPLHLRNAVTELMEDLKYGKGYKYAHDFENKKTDMQCMPDMLVKRKYFGNSAHDDESLLS